MKKSDEIGNQSSCWNKANNDERMFVLLARDPAAPIAIRAWIAERIRIGKNVRCDPQMIEAEDQAQRMEAERLNAVGR